MFHKFYIIIFLPLIMTSCTTAATPVRIENTVAPATETILPPPSDQQASEFPSQDSGFTTNNLNQVPPLDIIQEIYFYGGMGGCGRFCACGPDDGNEPTLHSEEDPVEVFQSIGFQICGIESQEIVHVSVEMPDGNRFQFEGNGSEGIEYVPDLRGPKGKYHLIFSGDGWNLEKDITVIDADGPRVYLTKDHQIIFYKFSPNEEVRLFAYDKDGKFIGWKTHTANSSGELSIKTDLDANFIAIGEASGQVFHRDEGEWINWSAWLGYPLPDVYCSSSAESFGIKPNGYAKVLVDSLPAFQPSPDGSWQELGEVYFGQDTVVRIASNAKCLDSKFYWYVECINKSCKGWIPETGPQGSYLHALQELPPTNTPDPANIPSCLGTKPTRLQIGMNAEVTTSGMAPQLSLRAQPSMSAEKVHVIAAGRDMVILQGPVCADNSYWWYIRSEQGFEGWAREGDHEDYWIDPIP